MQRVFCHLAIEQGLGFFTIFSSLGNEKNTAVAKEFTDAMMWTMRCVMQRTNPTRDRDGQQINSYKRNANYMYLNILMTPST